VSLAKRMTIRVKDADMIRLKAYADANDVGLAQAVREVLTKFLLVLERTNRDAIDGA